MKTPEDWAHILESNGLPPAPDPVIDGRWIARTGDWWVKTRRGWLWLDGRRWAPAPLGPP
jgi:hypothetical protein